MNGMSDEEDFQEASTDVAPGNQPSSSYRRGPTITARTAAVGTMDDLMTVMNQLQDVGLATGVSDVIDLPQIVVVGTQSSGKSSVLEHIVGKSFLPRGVGVVTRCPLALQLIHEQTPNTADYAIFDHKPREIIHDFKIVTKELEAETNRIAGTGKGIQNKAIGLKLFSNSFVNLTMVDLPGITRVPIGDQPPDIEKQVKDLILSYIRKPNCLILAVSPANADLSTSESLQLAAEVDPRRERTLAVLTKLDMMDQGTDAVDMLKGKDIPIKLGIVGVVNRSQLDINQNKSISDSLKDEEKFFANHYPQIASTQGSKYLTKKVQSLLIKHIQDCLPEVRKEINGKLKITKRELAQYEEKKMDSYCVLQDLLYSFTSSYVSVIKGRLKDVHTDEIYGGAKIYSAFNKFSSSPSSDNMKPLNNMTDSHIMAAIQNASGYKPAIFVPEVAFESLVKIEITNFLDPSLMCVDNVDEVLRSIFQSCIDDDNLGLKRYPVFKTELEKEVTRILDERISKTKKSVTEFIDIQIAHVNTDNPEFFTKQHKPFIVARENRQELQVELPAGSHSPSDSTSTDKHGFNLALVKAMVESYYVIVRGIVVDTVPKITMHYLVNYVMTQLQTELVKSFTNKAEDLMSESHSIIEQRKTLKKNVAALERMQQIMYRLSSSLTTNNL